jgi:predicted MPP superfamily phosphohydrolase
MLWSGTMPKISRRAFLRGSLLTGLAGACTYGYGRLIEPTWLDVAPVEHRLRDLPDAFAGFTIAQISDLHFGKYVAPAYIESVVDSVMALNADAIVITGDFVSRVTQGEPDQIVQTLSRLRAREDVYAVLGNHDWWENGPLVAESARRAGIKVLINEHISWSRGSQKLYLAGVDDVWEGKNDLQQTLAGIPADAAIVALVHEPDFADIVARDSRVLLQLSGHSHGGQICLPFYGGLHFPSWGKKYTSGVYHIDNLTLYTNRGIGMVMLPIRFACRPEVTLHRLLPASGLE